jgi:transposase
MKDVGAWFLFLPPYSPDLNPIEMAFAKLKTLIRRAAARSYDALWRAVGQVCDLFSEEECYNFFKAAGYEADRPQHALILLGLFADHCLTALLMD